MNSKNVHKKQIIVVDDDDDIRELVVMLLQHNGYRVTGMNDLEPDQLPQVPDLFILDMLLSGKNGKQLCSLIRSDPRFMHVPIVMMSALTDVKQECLDAGADEFILKPFEVSDIRSAVHQLLDKTPDHQSA